MSAIKELENVFNFIYEHLSYLASFTNQYLSWHGTILLFAILYFLIYSLVMIFFKKEIIKRKKIVNELNHYKEVQSSIGGAEKPLSNEDYMKTLLQRKQVVMADEYYDKMWFIVEKERPKPVVLMLSLTSQLIVAAVFFSFFSQVIDLSHHLLYYLFALGILIILSLKKDKLMLRIAILGFIAFVYWHLTSAALLFVSFFSLLRLISIYVKKIKLG